MLGQKKKKENTKDASKLVVNRHLLYDEQIEKKTQQHLNKLISTLIFFSSKVRNNYRGR